MLASTAAAALLVAGVPTHAQSPQAATVVAGSIAVTRQGATTVITQGTEKGIIDWRSFSIGAQEAVRFDQPGRSSVTLNRVTSAEISRIDGNLSATGQVWIANPNGVMIGSGGQVNVGGLLATTGRVDAAEFLRSGRASIDQISKDAAIVNQGTVNIQAGGYAALAAAAIRNDGVIAARSGSVAMGSGKAMTVDFAGDKLITFQVTQPLDQAPSGADALISGSGTVKAEGGVVVMSARAAKGVMDSVINLKGHVVATSVKVDGGTVSFGDGGIVRVSGKIDASDSAGPGGSVSVLGEKVGLTDGGSIDASGATSGGTVLVGGDWQGMGAVQNAQIAYVAPTASINADATANGNGGKVVVWADDTTRFNGSISARGGVAGGDGGRVETSGKKTLQVGSSAAVSAGARTDRGKPGAWLLDPNDIQIGGGVDTNVTAVSPFEATSDDAGSIVSVATLLAGLANGGAVIVKTTSGYTSGSGDITVAGAINFNDATPATLTLQADRDIQVNAQISASGSGKLGLTLGAGRSVVVGANITTGGGDFIVTANLSGSASGATRGYEQSGATVNAGAGTISITALASGGANAGVYLNNATLRADATGGVVSLKGTGAGAASDIELNSSTLKADGDVTLRFQTIAASGSSFSTTNGAVVFKPRILTSSIGVLGGIGGEAVQIDSTLLSQVAGNSSVEIGASDLDASAVVNVAAGAALPRDLKIRGGDANVVFAGDVDGASNGGQSLRVVTNGVTSFSGDIGAAAPLFALTIDGVAYFSKSNGLVKTKGAQNYAGSVQALSDTSFVSTHGGVTFNYLDGPGAVTVTSQTETVFANHLGNNDTGNQNAPANPLASLTVNGPARFSSAADEVVTVGSQSYGGSVVLGNVSGTGGQEILYLVSTGGGTVTFGGSVNAGSSGVQSISTSLNGNNAGAVVFNGSVGATSPLLSLTTTGTTYIGGDITTTDQQRFGGDVLLTASPTLTSVNSSIEATGSVNSQGAPKSVYFVATGANGHVYTTALGDTGPLDLVSINQTADVITQVATNNFARVAITTPGDVKVTTSASSYVIESITAGAGKTVELTALGSVTQNGPIQASSLLLTNRNAAAFTLSNPGNRIGVVAGTADSLNLTTGGASGLTVGAVTKVGDQNSVAGLTIANGLTLTQTGGGDLTINEAISAGRASLSAGGRIDASGPTIAVADGPLQVSANGGALQNVTVKGQTGPVDASFVRVISGSIQVNSVAVAAPTESEPPPAQPSTPAVTSAPSVASSPATATAVSVSSQPSVASVASQATAPNLPILAPTSVLADTTPAPPPILLESNAGLLNQIIAISVTFASPKLELAMSSQGGASNPDIGAAAVSGGLVASTPSGGLIPVFAATVAGSGAPLAATPTVKVDPADTGGGGGQVIAAFGPTGGQPRVILQGLLIDSTAIPGRRREEDEPLLSQQPSQMNEEYLLD